MAFLEERLSTDIERGANGGPRFKTRVLELESGFEQRNIDWSEARGEWDIGYGIMGMEVTAAEQSIHEIRNLFYVSQGRANGFRFKDWSDFTVGTIGDEFATRQLIALGDDATTTFQMFKRYTIGAATYDRNLKKPIENTVRAWMDTTELTRVASAPSAGEFSVDDTTGILTTGDVFASTGGSGPGGEEVLSITCEFDVAVRFDTDNLRITVEVFNAGAVPQIPIVEIRIA